MIGRDPGREAILTLIGTQVRLRFALDARTFAGRLGGDLDAVRRLCLEDLYLATACSLGDESAWAECADHHFSFIRNFAGRFLREPAASDVADQVIADLWQRGKIGRYEGRSSLRTWLGAVVAHAALNAVKAGRREAAGAATASTRELQARVDAAPAVDRDEESRLLADLLVKAIRDLGREDKLLLLMYYEQGLTLDDMVPALHASKATLSRRLRAARTALWQSLERLARTKTGHSAAALRAGLDLDRVKFDLRRAIGRLHADGMNSPAACQNGGE